MVSTKHYKAQVRKQMEDSIIDQVSEKIPGWLDGLFGLGQDFVAKDKAGKVWHVSLQGECWCEETGERR